MKKLSTTATFIVCALFFVVVGSSCDEKNGETPPYEYPICEGLPEGPVYVWPEGLRYYYGGGREIYVNVVPDKITLKLDKKYLSQIQESIQNNDQILQMEPLWDYTDVFVLTTAEGADVMALIGEMRKLPWAKSVNPAYHTVSGENEMYILNNQVVVKFREDVSQHEIGELLKKYCAKVIKTSSRGSTLLSLPVELDPLEVSNAIHESGLVHYSEPNIISKITYEH